jgi:hypothetical protein
LRLENKPTKDELQRHIQARTRESGEQELREARARERYGCLIKDDRKQPLEVDNYLNKSS